MPRRKGHHYDAQKELQDDFDLVIGGPEDDSDDMSESVDAAIKCIIKEQTP